jgi:hypothetical protein
MRMLDMPENALSEAELLHDVRPGTFFNVMSKSADGKTGRRGYSTDLLPEIMTLSARDHRDDDFYLSQATFSARSGCATNFHSVRALFVDLDSYKDPAGLATPEQVLGQLERAGLPEPSYIVSSGRGQYLKYLLEDRVYSEGLQEWGVAQRALVSATRPMHSDSKVKDCSRILRTLGSVNRASGGRRVQVVWDGGQTYRFRDLAERIGRAAIGSLEEERNRTPGRRARAGRSTLDAWASLGQASMFPLSALEHLAERHTPLLFSFSQRTPQSLAWCRFLDLKELVRMRGGVQEGERTTYLLWMMNFLAQSGTVHPDNFFDEVEAIASMMPGVDFEPLSEGSMGTLYRRVQDFTAGRKFSFRGLEIDPLYRPGNNYLIETFRIEPGEQRKLRTIIEKEVVKERREEKRRADGVRPIAEVIAQRTELRQTAAGRAAELRATGFTTGEIAAQMQITERSVRRYLQQAPRPAQTAKVRTGGAAAPGAATRLPITGTPKATDIRSANPTHPPAEQARRSNNVSPTHTVTSRAVHPVAGRSADAPASQRRCLARPRVAAAGGGGTRFGLPQQSGRAACSREAPAIRDPVILMISPTHAAVHRQVAPQVMRSHREVLVNPHAFSSLVAAARSGASPSSATRPREGPPVAAADRDQKPQAGWVQTSPAGGRFASLAAYLQPDDGLGDADPGGGADPDEAGAQRAAGARPVDRSDPPRPSREVTTGAADNAQLDQLREMQDRARRRQELRAADSQKAGAGADRAMEGPTDASPVWSDRSRPAGSRFSAEQWAAAREAYPQCSIFEFHRRQPDDGPIEAIFMAIPHARMERQALPAQLLDGSLVEPTAPGYRCGAGECALSFLYRYGNHVPQAMRMRLVMRRGNPGFDLYVGSHVELALGADAAQVFERAHEEREQAGGAQVTGRRG